MSHQRIEVNALIPCNGRFFADFDDDWISQTFDFQNRYFSLAFLYERDFHHWRIPETMPRFAILVTPKRSKCRPLYKPLKISVEQNTGVNRPRVTKTQQNDVSALVLGKGLTNGWKQICHHQHQIPLGQVVQCRRQQHHDLRTCQMHLISTGQGSHS